MLAYRLIQNHPKGNGFEINVACWQQMSGETHNYSWRPSKTDSAPVRGDGYEPGSSKFRLRANAETSHSVR